ncbi:MAG: 4Fe-4S dicluster domain-containing protein [Armatimonadota bacterium]
MPEARAYTIGADGLSDWVSALLGRAQVVAPRALHGSDVAYDVVESPAQVAWSYTTSLSPLKRQLFPQTDTLFCWHRQPGDGLELMPLYDEVERIFLGVRPCDVSAALLLDSVFGRDQADVYYLSRRRNSAMVALACTQPAEHCFCVCAHAGPFLDGGYDLQLTPLGDSYLAEVGSGKGAGLVEQAPGLFAPAPPTAVDARRELAQQAEQRFRDDRAYFAAALRKVTFDRVPEALWDQMADRCLNCGACAFVCPTCTCFTTADFDSSGDGVRCRLWDSCLYESYALEASGHNPRAEGKHRLKARFFHKLSYQFARKLGAHGCVGCGRCITACLGRNDMTKVTARIRTGEL